VIATDEALLLRDRPMPLWLRAKVAGEIVALYVRVRWLVVRKDLPEVVARLRGDAVDRHPMDECLRLGQRLGQPVRRTLDPLPWDSRCLMRSLVLLTMLARRGVVCQLVIGVRAGGEFSAHAWIEHDGRKLLPSMDYEPLTVI
jgi:hypothetical protein